MSEELQSRLQQFIKARNPELRTAFTDYSLKGLTKSRFMRVLSIVGFPLLPGEPEELADMFMLENERFVNWRRFIIWLGDVEEEDTIPTKKKGATITVYPEPNIQNLRNLRLKEHFLPFDRHNHGRLPLATFTRVLGQMNVNMETDKAKELVGEAYIAETDEVDWRMFIANLPQETVDNLKDTNPIGPSDDELLRKIKDYVDQRGLIIKPIFDDFDAQNRGRITEDQFQRCLKMLFPLNSNQINQLCTIYLHEEEGLIRYLPFISEVDPLYKF
ncbi:hypothetical protein PCE1_003296 [Barthelona sp. PCE]